MAHRPKSLVSLQGHMKTSNIHALWGRNLTISGLSLTWLLQTDKIKGESEILDEQNLQTVGNKKASFIKLLFSTRPETRKKSYRVTGSFQKLVWWYLQGVTLDLSHPVSSMLQSSMTEFTWTWNYDFPPFFLKIRPGGAYHITTQHM